MSVNSWGQFGGGYPSKAQQTQRASAAMSNAIHSAGMRSTAPKVPYRSTARGFKPTGSPTGQRWGELTRKNMPGRDMWGGKELPNLKFSGKVPQKSDYWHQMAEQPAAKTPKAQTTKLPRLGGGLGGMITNQGGGPGGVTGYGKLIR